MELPLHVVIDQGEWDHSTAKRIEEKQAAKLEQNHAARFRDGADRVPKLLRWV